MNALGAQLVPILVELARATSMGVLLVDEQGRVAWQNTAMAALLGLPEPTASPPLPESDLPGLPAAGITDLIHRLMDGDSVSGVLADLNPRDERSVRQLLHGGALRTGEGHVAGAWLVASDPQAGAPDPDRLLAMQRMEVVGLSVTGVVHDLNNILTALSGSLELLRGGQGTAPDLLAALDAMVRRSKDMAGRLLEVARPSSDTLEPLDLRTPVRQAADLMRHGFDPRVRIRLTLPTQQVPASGHRTALLQCLFNLGTNARDALPLGGQVALTLDVVRDPAVCRVQGWPGLRYARLRFSDDGPGIPPDKAARMFEPFFTTKTGRGTGMGLAVVQRVVHAHGGTVSLVPSEVGACFEIRLPMYLGPVEDDEPTRTMTVPRQLENPITPLAGRRVLVADDEEAVRLMLRQALGHRGAELTVAPDGETALTAAIAASDDGLPFHAALIDLHMPGLDGLDLIDALRLRSTSTRIVATSGLDPDPRVARALQDADVSFLRKPFRLTEAVEALLTP